MAGAALDVLNGLRRRGAAVYPLGGRLAVRPAPGAPLTGEDRAALREHSAAILALLGAGAWRGWFRRVPRGRWREVAGGATFGDCWAALVPYAEAGASLSEKIVLPAGRRP